MSCGIRRRSARLRFLQAVAFVCDVELDALLARDREEPNRARKASSTIRFPSACSSQTLPPSGDLKGGRPIIAP
jgi:hypothetical protein